ncbi:uncharacterized protein KD926_009604 [Aspergillus affinis]|uniref:uncharacterized protein n=1 Tax=Aspergillus affinis TaxID=1070780 RepID=UPI0022FE48A0|nr:uncharacterized protein KD926_009604 [Aspergillus affinis]KAI9045190.1 hypothetical protein KD926_009604 [Aspergillus affinis]
MLSILPLLLLGGLLPAVNGQNSDKEVLAHFATQGWCYVYVEGGDMELGSSPCKTWCPEHEGNEGMGCHTPVVDFDDVDPSLFGRDDEGNKYIPGNCVCGTPEDYLPLIEPVIEALSMLDNIICAVFLSSLETVAEIGINAVPGGAAINGVRRAVEGAKTFVDNSLDAANFFDNWIGKACDVPDWNFDLMGSIFGNLNDATDDFGTSKGCFQKKKSLCKDRKPNPKKEDDKKNDDKKNDDKCKRDDKDCKTTDAAPTTTKDSNSSTTKKDDSTSTSSTSTSTTTTDSTTSTTTSTTSKKTRRPKTKTMPSSSVIPMSTPAIFSPAPTADATPSSAPVIPRAF